MRGRLLDERCELGGRDRAHQGEVPARLVGPDLEAAARVVPLVEVDDACGADVIDLLAGLERRDADRERMHHHRPGEGVVTAGMSAFHTAGLVLFAAVAASAMTMTES